MTIGRSAAIAGLLLVAGSIATAAPRSHHHRPPRFPGPYPFGPQDPVPGPFPPPPTGEVPGYELEPPPVVEPTPRPSTGGGFYPQGFILDVPVHPADGDDLAPERSTETLTRYTDVGRALATCWAPPDQFDNARWAAITVRVSFKRNGAINGIPRFSYVDQGLTPAARSGLTRSLTDALDRCTPLVFSPTLGNAVAGQIFAIRFLEQDDSP